MSMAMPSVVSACAAPRSEPGQRAVATRGRRSRGRTRGASCPSTARSARRCTARARRRRGRCRCRTRAGSCRRARRGRCASSTGAHVEAEAVVGAQGERFEVGVGEEVVDARSRPRPAGSGRTGRRGARGAGRRPRSRSGRRATSSSSRFHSANGARGGAVDVVEGGEQPRPRRARRWRARGRSGRGSRARGRPGCAGGRARGCDRRPRRPICFDASHAARRSPASSLVRRISAMALSSTRSPSISPRKLLNVDSTAVSSSTIGPAQVGRHLVGHERVVEEVELAAQQRVAWRASSERVAASRTAAKASGSARQLPAGELGRGAAVVGRRATTRVFDSHHASASSISSGRSRASSSSATRVGIGGPGTAGSLEKGVLPRRTARERPYIARRCRSSASWPETSGPARSGPCSPASRWRSGS